MAYFQEALKALRPNEEFSTYDDDSVIFWNNKSVTTPSDKEIANKIAELKAIDEAAVVEKAEAKAAIADRLGLTDAELAILLA
jgi:hypothetical protein